MDGHADTAPEAGGLSDLASFLSDTPETEPNEQDDEIPADEPTAEEGDTGEDADSEQDESGDEPDDEPAPAEKITFKVKNEDGVEETVEFSKEELPNALMRQKDYTKKTQALVERESKAVRASRV